MAVICQFYLRELREVGNIRTALRAKLNFNRLKINYVTVTDKLWLCTCM